MPDFGTGPVGGRSGRLQDDSFELVTLFDFSRFRALPRLLDDAELRLLANETGARPELLKRLRKVRRDACNLYLNELSTDFRKLERAAMDYAANHPDGDPETLETILKIKFRFQISVWRLRLHLWCPLLNRTQTQVALAGQLVDGLLQPLMVRTGAGSP